MYLKGIGPTTQATTQNDFTLKHERYSVLQSFFQLQLETFPCECNKLYFEFHNWWLSFHNGLHVIDETVKCLDKNSGCSLFFFFPKQILPL